MIKTTDKITGEEMYVENHKSGLTIYIMPRKGYRKSYAVFATKYGSVDSEFIVPGEDEPTKVPDGIAHYLEHKMFDMPGDVNIFEKFSKYGASANAFTSYGSTEYLFSATRNFEESLKTLIEYVSTPYFTEESVQKEKGIIGQEIKMYDDNPDWAVHLGFMDCLYQKHPIKKNIAGSVESISKIDSALLYKCYNTFYNPSNMILFATGDFDAERILDIINEALPYDEGKTGEIKRVYEEEPTQLNKTYNETKLSVAQPQFMMGFKDNDNSADKLKRKMVTDILISMVMSESTPLYKKLLDEGLINDTFGGYYTVFEGCAYTSIEGESENPAAVRDMILEEIERIKRDGLSEEEFVRVKKGLWGDYIRSFDNLAGFTHTFISLKMMDIDYMCDYYDMYKQITFEDVKNRLFEHFNPEYFAMSVVNPIN